MGIVKRFSITLPDGVNADLERWAVIKGQPKAGIAAYLIEKGVEDAKDKGDLPRQPLKPLPQKHGSKALSQDVAKAWRKLIDGESLTADEEAAIAEVCDRSPAQVHDVVKRLRERGQ